MVPGPFHSLPISTKLFGHKTGLPLGLGKVLISIFLPKSPENVLKNVDAILNICSLAPIIVMA
jgi:hypothetical protein